VKELLRSYNLLDKLIAYVKDKGGNLSTLVRALNSMVSCAPLKLTTPCQGSCFGYVLTKHVNMLAMMQQYVLVFGRSI